MIFVLKNISSKQVCALSLILASLLILSAAFMEYVIGVEPCKMCYWQRYGHHAIFLLGLIGFFIKNEKETLRLFLIFLIVIATLWSGGVGLYQSLAQYGFLELVVSCGSGNFNESIPASELLASLQNISLPPSCSDKGFSIFGLTLAAWNFLIMQLFLIFITVWVFNNKGKNK